MSEAEKEEQEYVDSLRGEWKRSPVTNEVRKAMLEGKENAINLLIGAASKSTDPEVRAAYSMLRTHEYILEQFRIAGGSDE